MRAGVARNANEARRVLLARLPTLEHARLGGHTGGNLLLSMMQRYSGDFLDAIDGLRALLGCRGRVWPVSVQPASVCAEYSVDHIPMVRQLLGSALKGVSVEHGISAEEPGSPAPYVTTCHLLFDSVQTFRRAAGTAEQQMVEDICKSWDFGVIQMGEVKL